MYSVTTGFYLKATRLSLPIKIFKDYGIIICVFLSNDDRVNFQSLRIGYSCSIQLTIKLFHVISDLYNNVEKTDTL